MIKEKPQYLLGILMSGGANLLGMAASLITVMVAARLLSQDELGAFFLVMLLAQCTALFGDMGFQNTAIRTLSSLSVSSPDFTLTSRYIMTIAVLTSLAASLGVTCLLPFMTSLWPYQYFHDNAVLAAPVAFLTATTQVSMALLIGARQFRRLSILSAGMETLRAILSIGGLLVGFGVGSLLWGMIISRLIGISLMWAWMPFVVTPQFHHPQRSQILRFGGWLYGCSMMSVAMVRTADALLTTYLGPAALAVYFAAMQVPSALQRVFESIRPTLLGYVSSQDNAGTNPQTRLIRMMSALLAVAATGLIWLSSPLMTLLYSEKYAMGVHIMQALSVWAVFTVINYLYSVILIGNGQSKAAFLLTLPQFAVMLIAATVLVPRYQGFGAALALLVTAFIGNLVGAWLLGADGTERRGLAVGFLRVAVPLLGCLSLVTNMPFSYAMEFGFACLTIVLLVASGALTVADAKVLRAMLVGMVNRAPTSLVPSAVISEPVSVKHT
jgi:O-antigen/teichoic acid export membrane protein